MYSSALPPICRFFVAMSIQLRTPLRFEPLFRRYLWGGRRLADMLGKPIGAGDDYAESWEIVDHDDDQSIVQHGPAAGKSLAQLVASHCSELLGRHAPRERFPLLMKFLDCNKTLSVQVHPNDEQASHQSPPDLGKTEAWLVLHALPDSRIYAGLRPGVTSADLALAIAEGRCEECLHQFPVAPGDCVFIPAGTVHALGAGLVIAEIQQASDTTFRLFDWNRVDKEGNARPLHIEQSLAVIDFERGPVSPQQPQPTSAPHRERLVACDKFVLDRCRCDEPVVLGGDDRCHLVVVLAGELALQEDPAQVPLRMGECALVPAACGEIAAAPSELSLGSAGGSPGAEFLDIYLPD
jgi:mannose-6-phosphate isomerase